MSDLGDNSTMDDILAGTSEPLAAGACPVPGRVFLGQIRASLDSLFLPSAETAVQKEPCLETSSHPGSVGKLSVSASENKAGLSKRRSRKRKPSKPQRISRTESVEKVSIPKSDNGFRLDSVGIDSSSHKEDSGSTAAVVDCTTSVLDTRNSYSMKLTYNGEPINIPLNFDDDAFDQIGTVSEGYGSKDATESPELPESLSETTMTELNVASQSSFDNELQEKASKSCQFPSIEDMKPPKKIRRKRRNFVPYSLDKDGNKIYTCECCDKVFNKSNGLISHRRIHTGETPFECGYCNKKFNVRSNLAMHLRIHTGEMPFTCAVCNKGFKQSGQLTQHLRCHTGELPFLCHLCNKAFRNKSALTIHIRIHTGEKPYECEVCHKTFSVISSLKTHRLTHTGERPFPCQICGRKFNRKNNLNMHIKLHVNVPSHVCELCGKAFIQRGLLLVHKRKSHKMDDAYASEVDKHLRLFGRGSIVISGLGLLDTGPENTENLGYIIAGDGDKGKGGETKKKSSDCRSDKTTKKSKDLEGNVIFKAEPVADL